jgi:hypothetical protein
MHIRAADQENRAMLSRLEQIGISIGHAGDASPRPDRLIVKQTDYESATIYQLPLGAVGVVLPAEIIVRTSGPLITEVLILTAWDEYSLELWDPEDYPGYYRKVIEKSCHFPPQLLNPYLQRELPLRVCQKEGIFIAHGFSTIPSTYHDASLAVVKLRLLDERDNELCVDFKVTVDRSVDREFMKQHGERMALFQPSNRSGLFGPNRRQPENPNRVFAKGVINPINPSNASGDRNVAAALD